jgi:hypothetical protein
VETIIRHFVTNPQRCQSKTGKPHRQPDDADDVLGLVFPQVAESDFEIMNEHIFD